MRAQGTSGARPPGPSDREIWRRSHEIEAPADEAEQLLDLAAFADNRLDEDDAACVFARNADAADDVAAARLLADATVEAADPGIIARAAALVGENRSGASVIAFPARPPTVPWYRAASWSGLAAAMVLAGWLGFNLGSSGLPGVSPALRANDEASSSELLDPTPSLILRDFTENSQI
jgi:hypothetical protein